MQIFDGVKSLKNKYPSSFKSQSIDDRVGIIASLSIQDKTSSHIIKSNLL